MTRLGGCAAIAGWVALTAPLCFGQLPEHAPLAPPAVSPSGYGGVGFTPSANPIPQGMAVTGFSTALPGKTSSSGFNFIGSFGLLPGLELTGRLMTRDLQCNLYVSDCGRPPGIRDLSAGLKLSTSLFSSADSSLLAAVGVTDFGGAATLSRAVYAAGTWNTGRWSWSAGYLDAVSASAFGQGPFASVSWLATEGLQVNAEAVNRDVMGSIRLWVPSRWLPRNTAVYVDMHQHLRQSAEVVPRTSFGVGVAIDLDPMTTSRPPPSVLNSVVTAGEKLQEWIPRWESPRWLRFPSQPVAVSTEEPQERRPSSASGATPDAEDQKWTVEVVAALEQAGFEDVSVGHSIGSDRWVIRFENIDYQHNDLDALAVAAGAIAAIDDTMERRVTLRLMRRGVESIDFDFPLQCLQGFLQQGRPCSSGELALRASDRDLTALDWLTRGQQRSWLVPRVYVVPAIESRIGTEYGAWDASVAANVAVHIPLWRGALIEGTQIFPVNDTRDFKAGGVFSRYRFSQKTDHRVMFHQAVGLPLGFSGRVATGRVGDLFDGYLGELRWEPASGQHKLSVEKSKFKVLDQGFSGDGYLRSQIVNYRYFSESLQATLEIKAGKFFNGDDGYLVFSRFWFGDVTITPYYRKSSRKLGFFPQRPFGRQVVPPLPEREFAGLEFAFPLSPRKGFSTRRLRVNGNDRFFYSIETVVNNPTNDLLREYGQFTPVPLSLDGTVFNFDRASDAYLRSNLHRLPLLWRKISDRATH
jgi:hypothetical protein